MPCGGIYPVSKLEVDDKPELRKCWICRGSNALHFCAEWDTYIHSYCVPVFLLDDEGQIVINHGHTINLDFMLEPAPRDYNITIHLHRQGRQD